jgi:hypothetical protein
MKPGDTVSVYVYETLVHETAYVLTEGDFDEDGDVDTEGIEQVLLEEGIDWNACDVMSREVQVWPCPTI